MRQRVPTAGCGASARVLRGAGALVGCVVLSGALAAGCGRRGKFRTAQVLGGKRIAASVLNRGHVVYVKNCEVCHGERGDGRGPAAATMVPRPRDFTLGFFKYISVPDSGLPTDADLIRSARKGVPGTRMPAWAGLPDGDLEAAVHYLKTFSPRWRKRTQGKPLPMPPDPYRGAQAARAAEARGEGVYHGAAQCWTCHPAYLPRPALLALATRAAASRDAGKRAPGAVPVRSRVHRPAPVQTRYGLLTPPDFLVDPLRGGAAPEDIYRAVAAGIGGTPMPTWAHRLPARDLWAVTHYVGKLVRMRGSPEARRLRATWAREAPRPRPPARAGAKTAPARRTAMQ